jgi:YbbR domain-containing protein
VTKNLHLKLVSLLAAALLAYSLQDASNASVVSLFVPIEIRNPPVEKMLVKRMKQGVQVTIRGPSFLIGEVAASPPPLRLKLPDDVDGKYVAQLMSSDISLPPSVNVLSMDPQEVELVFEGVEERQVKIEVPQLGLLAKELELVSLDLDPRTVTVRGPRSELKQIRSVETEPLDLRDIKGSESVTLQLRKPGAMSSISLESVTVKVEVQRKPVERQFPGRPIELRTSLDRKWLKFNPEVVQVTVVGQEDEISEVDPREILPFITLNSLPERSGEPIEVQVDVPKGTKALKVSPANVTVWYSGPSKSGTKTQPTKKTKGR